MTLDSDTFTARVSAIGTSLCINCTKQIKRLGLGRGDLVKVTIERIPGGTEDPPERE